MPNPSIEDQIQLRTEAFASELSGLVRQAALEAVEQALAGTGSSRASTTRRKKGGRRKAAGATRKTTRKRRGRMSQTRIESLQRRIHDYLQQNDGSRLEEISRGINKPSKDLKVPIKNMLEDGTLRKTGQKRGTTYFNK